MKQNTEPISPNQNITLYVYFKYLFFIWILRNPSLRKSLRAKIFYKIKKTIRRGIIYMYVFKHTHSNLNTMPSTR